MGKSKELFMQLQDEMLNTIHQVEEGELTHLDGLLRLRESKKPLEDTLEIIKDFESNNLNEIEREASKYPGGYMGFEIKAVSGRKTYSYKGISEVEQAEAAKKALEDTYRAAFEGFQKGVVQTAPLDVNDPDSPLGWVDEYGQVLPFPELNYGKSYIAVKQLKPKK